MRRIVVTTLLLLICQGSSADPWGRVADGARTYAFPSPARNVCVRIASRSEEPSEAELRVYNERGDLVLRRSGAMTLGWNVWDPGLCHLPPGIYRHRVVLRYASGTVETLQGEPFAVLR